MENNFSIVLILIYVSTYILKPYNIMILIFIYLFSVSQIELDFFTLNSATPILHT